VCGGERMEIVVFHDGDEDQNFRNIGPRLHHFHNSSLTATQEEKQQKWSNRSGKRSCLIVLQSLHRKSQSMMKAELPLSTGTANQPQLCDDGTISPYPELRVHSGHTSMSVGTSTTTPNHFSLSKPKAIPFKQAPSTPHHTTGSGYQSRTRVVLGK